MHNPLILEMIYLLLAAVFMVPLCQAIGLGAVPGFLLAGILIGPSVLGLISDVAHIAHISEFGVVLLLFVIGMEMKPSFLWKIKRLVFGLGSLQVLLTSLIIILISRFLLGLDWPAAIIIGCALSLSSTAFVLQILTQQKSLNTEFGRSSVAVLLMQDLAVVPLLALIPLLSESTGVSHSIGYAVLQSVGIIVAVIMVGKYLLNPLLYRVAKSANAEVFTATAVLIVLGTAYLTEIAGLSMAMGAFLAGLLISDSAYRHQIKAEVQPFRGLLLGAFFISMGMSLNIPVLLESPLLVISLMLLTVAIKTSLLTLLAKSFGHSWQKSAAVGFLLGQSGEFALVLFSLAFAADLLTAYQFNIAMLVVLLSMLITPLLAIIANKFNNQQQELGPSEVEVPECAVVLAGFGRVGRSIGAILETAGVSYVAFDRSSEIVKKYQDNYPVFYGDVTQSHLLSSAGIHHAKLAIVTLNDTHAALELVESLRHRFPDLNIIARAHNSDNCLELLQHGANDVVSENVEASLELTELALKANQVDDSDIQELLSAFRLNYYNKIRNMTDNL